MSHAGWHTFCFWSGATGGPGSPSYGRLT